MAFYSSKSRCGGTAILRMTGLVGGMDLDARFRPAVRRVAGGASAWSRCQRSALWLLSRASAACGCSSPRGAAMGGLLARPVGLGRGSRLRSVRPRSVTGDGTGGIQLRPRAGQRAVLEDRLERLGQVLELGVIGQHLQMVEELAPTAHRSPCLAPQVAAAVQHAVAGEGEQVGHR